MSFFKRHICDHDWQPWTLTYVRCSKCNKYEFDPRLNWDLSDWGKFDDNILPPEVIGLKQYLKKHNLL